MDVWINHTGGWHMTQILKEKQKLTGQGKHKPCKEDSPLQGPRGVKVTWASTQRVANRGGRHSTRRLHMGWRTEWNCFKQKSSWTLLWTAGHYWRCCAQCILHELRWEHSLNEKKKKRKERKEKKKKSVSFHKILLVLVLILWEWVFFCFPETSESTKSDIKLRKANVFQCGLSVEVADEDGVGDGLHAGLDTQRNLQVYNPHTFMYLLVSSNSFLC